MDRESPRKGLDLPIDREEGGGTRLPIGLLMQESTPDRGQPCYEENCKENEPPIGTPTQRNSPLPESPSPGLGLPGDNGKGNKKAPPIGTPAEENADPFSGFKLFNRATSKEKSKITSLLMHSPNCFW